MEPLAVDAGEADTEELRGCLKRQGYGAESG